ncbi:MAG TPA: RsiV family protein [Rhabdochlamydiaceae bacterium]|nr:RsiV family protein [Rhabdochlamydiaceae bacterium]
MPYFCFFLLFLLSACGDTNNLSLTKQDFIEKLFEGHPNEGPFQMRYSLRTVLFSKEVISLFGETDLYSGLPHGSGFYEGKTYCKINGKYQEITLNDFFTTSDQKEFLRQYCEKTLKTQPSSYFSGNAPLRTDLKISDINTFVIDGSCLIIIFQPYAVSNYVDGPFVVRIPFDDLKRYWNLKNPLALLLPLRNFISSWEKENTNYQP